MDHNTGKEVCNAPFSTVQRDIELLEEADQYSLKRLIRNLAEINSPASTEWRTLTTASGNEPEWKFAAVLVPILLRVRPSVLLTKRSLHLIGHPGHVGFPGGRPKDSDGDVGTTALRESYEEIKLEAHNICIHGCLPPHRTRKSGNIIVPVVATLYSTATWQIQPEEVEEIFEFPFSLLTNPELPRRYISGERAGAWYWAGHEQDVWGVTAAILISLARAIRAA